VKKFLLKVAILAALPIWGGAWLAREVFGELWGLVSEWVDERV
jgi:hypothetical protein